PRPGSRPATEATLTIWPRPRAIIAGRAARVSSITAVTLTSSWALSSSSGADQNSPLVPNPALLISTSTPPESRAATKARPSARARSAASTSAETRCAERSSSARAASLSVSRATSTTSWSRAARARANPAPMPEVGPVIRATGLLMGPSLAPKGRGDRARGEPRPRTGLPTRVGQRAARSRARPVRRQHREQAGEPGQRGDRIVVVATGGARRGPAQHPVVLAPQRLDRVGGGFGEGDHATVHHAAGDVEIVGEGEEAPDRAEDLHLVLTGGRGALRAQGGHHGRAQGALHG